MSITKGKAADNGRDDFIAMMIAELSKQKSAQGNTTQFVTGGFLTSSDVFRKMCFDYPLLDDQALQILVVGLKTLRQSSKPSEFRDFFCMHDKFLENITYLIHDIEHVAIGTKSENDDDVDSDNECEDNSQSLNFTTASIAADRGKKKKDASSTHVEPSKRGKVLAQVAGEVYMHYPGYLMKLSKTALTPFWAQDNSHLFSPSPTARVVEDLTWMEIIHCFRNYLLKSNVTIVATNTDAKTLISNGSLAALLELITALQKLIDITSPNNTPLPNTNNTTSTKNSNQITIIEYLETQFTMYMSRKEGKKQTSEVVAGEDEEDLQAEQLLAMTKEMWTHVVYLYIDVLCRIPELLSSQYMPLSDALFQFPQKASAGSAARPASMEDLFLLNSKQKTGPSLPFPSQYLGLMMVSNISNYLTKEMELGHHPTLLRTVKEDIRKYFSADSSLLTQVVEICERIRDYNQHNIVAGNNAVKLPIDLESTNFLLDIAELLMYSDRYSQVTSTVASSIMTKFISSRLLASLMMVYVDVLQLYQQLLLPVNAEEEGSQQGNATAQLWLVSCRLTRVLSQAILLDVHVATFVFQYPNFLPQISAICKASTLSSAASQHIVWSPSFSATMVFCLGLTLSTNSISLQDMMQDNLNLLTKEVSGLEVDVLKEEREDAEQDDADDNTAAVSSNERPTVKRSHFSNQTRQLEGLIFITQLLVHDEIRTNVTRVDMDANKSKLRQQLFTALRSSLSTMYRIINRGRSSLNETGVNSVSLSYYDKAMKNVKALLSLLEGGVTSKAD